MAKNKKILGYKAFHEDLTCRNSFQYEIGKTYEHDNDIIPCVSGFHFCKTLKDCYKFYPMSSKSTRICKIEALGDIKTDDNIKFVTNKIKILSEVKNPKTKSNSSDGSTGFCNDGNWNSGSWNAGRRNTGNENTGDCNSGNRNSGDWNTGDENAGILNTGNHNIGSNNNGSYNIGNRNSGDWNTGDYNTGDWNIGNCNTGIFNSERATFNIFDKPSSWTYNDWLYSKAYEIMSNCPCGYSLFISETNMTTKEKEEHPDYIKVGGYLKIIMIDQKDRQDWWNNLPETDKQEVMSLPNFDKGIFYRCTGISV